MKKIIFTVLLATASMAFAKTDESNKHSESKNVTKTVLKAKKTIEMSNQQQKPIKISTTGKQQELTPQEMCIIELALGPVIAGPPYHCTQI